MIPNCVIRVVAAVNRIRKRIFLTHSWSHVPLGHPWMFEGEYSFRLILAFVRHSPLGSCVTAYGPLYRPTTSHRPFLFSPISFSIYSFSSTPLASVLYTLWAHTASGTLYSPHTSLIQRSSHAQLIPRSFYTHAHSLSV